MRLVFVLITGLFLMSSCGSSSSPADAAKDSPPGLPKLTVNNTLSWCDVTVTVGTATAVMFANATHDFNGAASTSITLHATPHPTFLAVVWTGVTTMNGADATYVMTAAATQTVTACCPLSNGTGC